MSMRNIGVVFRKELVDSLRDRRTLISMVVVPILLMPVLTIGMSALTIRLVNRARQDVPKVMILGGQDSPRTVTALKQAPGVEFVAAAENYKDEIIEKRVRAAVEIPPGFDAALESGETKKISIYYYEGEIRSQFASQALQGFFRSLRDRTVSQRMAARNIPETLLKPFDITPQNVAPPEKVGGNILGGLIPYMVILLCLTGAMYPAMDLTAGEKERGTMETILCSPISRTHLVLGKFLMVLTAALATAMLSIASMAVSFKYAKSSAGGQMADARRAAMANLTLDPKGVIAVFAMVLPIAVMFAAALLAISLFAKSFKEAQSYISPLMIVVILPAVAAMLPGIELNTRLALIPILNTSLVSKEIVTGTYHWNYIAIIFASSCVYAAIALFVAVKLFQREDVLFRA